jgi:hypothetical protein
MRHYSLRLDEPHFSRLRRKLGDKAGVNLTQCLDLFVQPETLDEQNTWYCGNCKAHVCATKTLQVWSLPEVLIVHLKRFEARNIVVRDKLSTHVACPLTGLDLTGFDLHDAACGGVQARVEESSVTDGENISALRSANTLVHPDGWARDAVMQAATGSGTGTVAEVPPALPPALYDCYAVVNHYGQVSAWCLTVQVVILAVLTRSASARTATGSAVPVARRFTLAATASGSHAGGTGYWSCSNLCGTHRVR